jgi:hypothetical protein
MPLLHHAAGVHELASSSAGVSAWVHELVYCSVILELDSVGHFE